MGAGGGGGGGGAGGDAQDLNKKSERLKFVMKIRLFFLSWERAKDGGGGGY